MDNATQLSLPSSPAGSLESAASVAEVRVACHEGGIPAFVQDGIDMLYGHLYSSPRYFEAAAELAGASAYVATRGNSFIAIFPYKRDRNTITVVSEYLTVEEAEIRRFADYMFRRYPGIRRLTFPKVEARIGKLPWPSHAVICSEDMVIDLPPTVDAYQAALGKNMRRNLRRYSDALLRAFPTYRYELYLDEQISERDLRDIVALSCLRMKSKNIVPRFDETEIRWITEFARSCGIVGIARIEGEVCAGAIGFRIGGNYFMHVIAHDTKYNDFSLGILCYYHTICEGIRRGATRFHLLQGRYGYKYRLLAKRHDMIHLDIYRSRKDALLCSGAMLRKEARGRLWLARQWLVHDLERKEGRGYRMLGKAINALRQAKRARGQPGTED